MKNIAIKIAARNSALSKQQTKEILSEIRAFHPGIEFEETLLQTTGDLDKKTSLRDLDKTDFFTKEVDQLILNRKCRIGIHSAKDLPEPLAKGLILVALTKGVDSSDSLVLRKGESLAEGFLIATSSMRREEAVSHMCSGLLFRDLRGTIHERLQLLETGDADGIVVAEAALIRLGLTHLNRLRIPGDTVPLQGKLAIIAHEEDEEMKLLFKVIDAR